MPAVSEPMADAQPGRVTEVVPPDITEPPVAPPVRRKKRRVPHPIGWTLGVVLLMSMCTGSVHFMSGLFSRPAAVVAPEPAPPVPPPLPPSAPPLPRDAMPYAVALEAHQNLATAFERTDALAAAHGDISFFVAPLERNGVLHYHVMAGPVADSAAALAVRDTLIARRVKTTSTPSDIRYTPLALLIGDYSARDAAEQQVAELRRLDIPAYLVIGAAADSAPLYRVFVGGFSGPAEADVARQLLRAAGVRDHLVNRTRSSAR
jgi:cell division septation protein DedD